MWDPSEKKFSVIGKNPDYMYSLTNASFSSESTFSPKEGTITDISISDTYTLMVYD